MSNKAVKKTRDFALFIVSVMSKQHYEYLPSGELYM